ncbi:MAG: hypothetical protein AAF649_04490 [Verrucomicrobiota bacterium]
MLVIAFPTEFEAHDLLKLVEKKEKRVIDGVTCFAGYVEERAVMIPIIGIGPTAASYCTEALLKNLQIKVFILAGFAGAITPELERGQILVIKDYSAQSLINYLKLVPGFDIGQVHPVMEVVSSAEEKKRLGEETGCQMVDMETAYVAHMVASAGIEFLGVRAISDLVDEDIPNDALAAGYDHEKSKTTPFKMFGFLARHPKQIKPLKEFVSPLPEVRKKLTDFVVTLIKEF